MLRPRHSTASCPTFCVPLANCVNRHIPLKRIQGLLLSLANKISALWIQFLSLFQARPNSRQPTQTLPPEQRGADQLADRRRRRATRYIRYIRTGRRPHSSRARSPQARV